VLAAQHALDGRRLMRVELIDAARLQDCAQAGIERRRNRRIAARPGGHALPRDDIAHERSIGAELKKQ
jgi:hypothetical protein